MSCPHTAVLLIAREVAGTSTNVARATHVLTCSLSKGHEGPHRDDKAGHEWVDDGKTSTYLVENQPAESER